MKYLLSFSILIAFYSCSVDGTEDYEDIFQTRILSVEINPQPVTRGDTLKLKCIITDSLDSSFKYLWKIEGMSDIETSQNSLNIIWKNPPGTYNGFVDVDNSDDKLRPPNSSFPIISN